MIEKSRQGGLRILFADDEAHLRDLMQLELPRLGHEVTVCPDGTAALRALERGSYDAALLPQWTRPSRRFGWGPSTI